MTIFSGDIALLASQVMDDVPEGGGRPTANLILDATNNGIFNDISEVDRAGGRVNLRKIFPSVRTTNTDGFFGANMIVSEVPQDAKVSITLFSTGDTFDTRANAKSRVESYLALGARYPGYLFGNHIAGQNIVSILQSTDLPVPVQGDTIALRGHEATLPADEQYVKVLQVSSRVRTFEDDKGKYSLTEVILTLTDALGVDFKGFDASRSGPAASDLGTSTKLYSTIVADASRYYGASGIQTAALTGDLTIKTKSIFTQLVPSTKVEVPVSDARITQRKTALVKAGDPYSFIAAAVFTTTQSLYIGGMVLPGSLTLSIPGVTLTDSGNGTLNNGANSVGTIDYANGIAKLASNVFGASQSNIAINYTPASGPTSVTTSIGVPVTTLNQRISWVFTAESLPARGSTQVSFRAFAQWYTLTDDGSGALRGADKAFGAGSINYSTGTISVTLGVMPDVGSQIIVQWVDTVSTTPINLIPSDGIPQPGALMKPVQLDRAVVPGSLVLTWLDGATTRTATDSNGVLTGDAIGRVNYANGRIAFSPKLLPAKNTEVNIALTNATPVMMSVVGYTDSGANWTFSLGAAVKPMSLEMVVFADMGSGTVKDNLITRTSFGSQVTVFDDGNGHLQIANGSVNLTIGSINYTTGACVLAKSTPGYITHETYSIPFSIINTATGGVIQGTKASTVTATQTVEIKATGMTYMLGYGLWATDWWTIDMVSHAVRARFSGSTGAGQTYYFTVDSLFFPTPVAPTSFDVDMNRHIVLTDNTVTRNPSPATGVGTLCGAMGTVGNEYGVVLNSWVAGTTGLVTAVQGVDTQGTAAVMSTLTFRSAISPLFSGAFSLLGTRQDGTIFNVTPDSSGIINSSGVFGKVDFSNGIGTVLFGTKVADDQANMPGVLDVRYLEIPNTNYVKMSSVRADSLRYNAVGYSYLPIDQNILGLNPVRLPADGRVPIFRAGGFAVVGNTQTIGPVQVSNGQIVDCARVRLSRVRVIDANNAVINTGYTVDLDAGQVAFTDVAAYAQPVKIEHRIEDMAMISDVQISGQLTFTRQLTHDYPVIGTTVSSALMLGDLHARVSTVFDQVTWTNTWSDLPIGSDALGTYNTVLSPIVVTNKGALTERWSIVFQSTTTFQVIGEHIGVIATGSINTECAPVNPSAGVPYFTIPALGWGAGWAVGNVLRFNTVGASPPVWVARTILQGSPTVGSDQFTLLVRGDIDNPN